MTIGDIQEGDINENVVEGLLTEVITKVEVIQKEEDPLMMEDPLMTEDPLMMEDPLMVADLQEMEDHQEDLLEDKDHQVHLDPLALCILL